MTPETGTAPAETLRPEARPLPYAHLDKQQQEAVDRVVGLLTAAAQDAKVLADANREARSAEKVTAGPYLDASRCSRNLLLGGDRGTGKTTLMMSLAKVLDVGRNAPRDENLPQGVAKQADELTRRLIWLETLDMEPLAGEANLLGAVLARIEDAVGARFPNLDKVPETVPLLYPGRGYHDVARELARLQTSVALTFGGNLSNRAGSLDPDTFAVESRRAERERLALDRRFAEVLAGLSTAVASAATGLEAPVFVLPVDDMDLNVSACVPLLRLLRATTSPHLIVLLAADVALLSTIMRLNYQGDLARVNTMATLGEADQRVAADLAVNALRKHLPPAQRVVLGLVEPGQALALKPLGPDTDSLGQKLGRIELPADSAALHVPVDFGLVLADAAKRPVTTAAWWQAGLGDLPAQLTERLAPYSWPRILGQPLRRLVDLYLDCAMHARQQERYDPLIHATADDPLTQLARARLEALRSGVRGSWTADAYAWLDPLPDAPTSDGPPVVARRAWYGWQASIGEEPLASADAAVLVGCTELTGERQQGNPSPPQARLDPVRATWWPSGGSRHGDWIDWPWVTHSTYWGYERAMAWLAQAEKIWARDREPDPEFGSWVAVMTAQLFPASPAESFDGSGYPFATNWNSLAGVLSDLDKTPLGQAWLDAVGLLCTPEMGMASQTSFPSWLPPGRAEPVQALRAERAKRLPSHVRKLAGLAAQQDEQVAEARLRPVRAQRRASAAPEEKS